MAASLRRRIISDVAMHILLLFHFDNLFQNSKCVIDKRNDYLIFVRQSWN